ncbi:DinB family protein [Brevibacterium sanguinis]|nr:MULTISPECIES: helix-turn-helix domain-containing protein [Brevibacterium]RBP64981.1 DinB family protein [Brevibacterium sanguinis]
MTTNGRDRLRELLDAVLDERHGSLDEMAAGAFSTRFHFGRTVSRQTGESPVAMRRRVMLERAAWQLRQGTSVADAAWTAGYSSVEGFSRAFSKAFGRPPSSEPESGHWLPSPNGIHFHPPTSLWVNSQETLMNPLSEQLVRHDLDDISHLIRVALRMDDEELHREVLADVTVLEWDGGESSIRAVLENLVFTKEVWLAAVDGQDLPERRPDSGLQALQRRHEEAGGRWLAFVRDIDRRGAWDDRLIDALCDPPESFVISAVVAHVLTYSAHRRHLVRHMVRRLGHAVDEGDPIMWLRRLRGEEPDIDVPTSTDAPCDDEETTEGADS